MNVIILVGHVTMLPINMRPSCDGHIRKNKSILSKAIISIE